MTLGFGAAVLSAAIAAIRAVSERVDAAFGVGAV
jgi:hypothetical protein